MRISILARSTALLLVAAAPLLVRAQFQAPTQQELQMTSDPKAPGAAAVYLNIEEIDNDPMHFRTYYARIKVLTEKGKSLATVEIPYSGGYTIGSIEGRTIHPDGTIIPLNVAPADLLLEKSGDERIQRKVFTLPSVEVGSILEYRYQLRYSNMLYSSPDWEVQQPYFVHHAHFQFTAADMFTAANAAQNFSSNIVDAHGDYITTLMWWPLLPKGASIKSDINGRYSLDIDDVPPLPNEEWMPPEQDYRYHVRFYYKNAVNPTEFWITEAKYWSRDVDHFAGPTKTIHTAVDSLIAPGDSDLVKAQKLYAAVQALDNTDFSRQKSDSERRTLKLKEIKRAEDTWLQKGGSREDIALLYLSMLRAAGLTAYAIKVVDRDKGTFDPSYMSTDQLDDTLVFLSIGGKQIVLDPGEKMCPFQTISWKHAGVKGISQSASGPGIAATPELAFANNTIRRTGDLNLDADGGITGTMQIVMTGQEALAWRQAALSNDSIELKKDFDRMLANLVPAGVEAHLDHFLGLDQPDSLLMAVVQVKGTLGTATAHRLILPGFFFETGSRTPFVKEEKRIEPVDMRYGSRVIDQLTYHLPAGISVEGAPPDTQIPWQNHALYIAKTRSGPDQITVARILACAFSLVPPDDYQRLRSFFAKVAESDQQQIVLSAAGGANGK